MVCCVVAAAVFGLFVRALHPRRWVRRDATSTKTTQTAAPVTHRRVEVTDGALVGANQN